VTAGATGPATPTDPELAKVERIFDRWAPDYEKNEWYKAQGREVLEHLSLTGERLIVDVGCGTGWLLRQALAAHPEARGIGIDLSSKMIERARENAEAEGLNRVRFVTGNWEAAGADDGTSHAFGGKADVVFCVSAFHYFRGPRAALAKMFRSLRPGGELFLLDREMEGSALTRIWGGIHRFLLRDHVRFYTSSRLLRWMEEAGFCDRRVVTTIRKRFRGGKLYTSLVLLSARKPGASDGASGAVGGGERGA